MKNKKHWLLFHQLILLFIIVAGVGLFSYFKGFPDKQFLIAAILASSYFLWGLIYHRLQDDLHLKIVIEYLLIALLSILLLRGAIYR